MPGLKQSSAAILAQTTTNNQRATLSGPLDPYIPSTNKPWNLRRVMHLYRRLGFSCTYQQAQAGLLMDPSDLVDQLLDTAYDLGSPIPPYWSNYTSDDYTANPDLIFEHRDELYRRWMSEMLNEGIRAKMALFWHNHFVTELNTYQCNAYLWSYFETLHTYAFGNFKAFAREMGKNAAMLVYLNGNISVASEPNENYARELMELFTMGESNGYTQSDIVQMAKALTGWRADNYLCIAPSFDAQNWDSGPKTIFGITNNFDFNQAHNLIFTARAEQVSHFITEKIYKNFVYQTPDPAVVQALATAFQASNWEILPILKMLFKSDHFFDDKSMNCRLKNPVETFLPMLNMAGASYPDITVDDWLDSIRYFAQETGQNLFNPPNVAGWKGYRTWLNESTLTARWQFGAYVAYFLSTKEESRENLRAIAQSLTNDSNNPNLVVKALVEYFTGQDLDPIHLLAATEYFKAGIPENYFLDGSWNLIWDEAPYQIINMLYYLVKLPEYQLT